MDLIDAAFTAATGKSSTPIHLPALKTGGPRGSRMGLVAIGIILILSTLVLPFVASAGITRTGATVDVGQVERITGDFNAVAGDITLAGTITGDANVAGRKIDVPGTVEGSLNVFGGSVTIIGNVRHSARIVAGQVDVTGNIAGDLIVAGGRVTIPSQARIAGDLIVTGGTVDFRGTVAGRMIVRVSNVTIGGTVTGDADVSASSIDVLAPAKIGGDLTYDSASTADVAPNAVVTGTTTQNKPLAFGGASRNIFNPWLRVVWALLAGVVVIALAPRLMSAVGKSGRRILPAFGIGIVSLIIVPILAFLLMITVIGLPVGLIFLAAFLIALYLSQVIVGTMLGRLILSGRWDDGSRGFNLLCMTVGVIIISALRFIPLPYVSGGVSIIVSIWGLGTATMLFSRLRPQAIRDLART